jgi:hypothetical protein
MTQFLCRMLIECEREHKRLGLDADTWAEWYAAYISPRLSEWHMATYGGFAGATCQLYAARPDVRDVDGITEG